MDDLVERLRTLSRGDHARGCQGREYHCDCGYDAQAWEAADEAAARITALEASLAEAKEHTLAAMEEATHFRQALAEAEGRVVAEVVAWLEARSLRQDTVSSVLVLAEAATALENGEWKK